MSGERARPGAGTIAAIALTARGSRVAARLATELPAVAYVPARFLDQSLVASEAAAPRPDAASLIAYDERAGALTRRLFTVCGGLIPVMAVGAAVRLLAPLLADKRSDPAVVVVDDAGRFAVSLVSGHVGGANRLAERVASILGATAVITTASESAGVPSPDLLGSELGWRIEPSSALKAVAAALVNGESVAAYQDCGERSWLEGRPEHLRLFDSLEALASSQPSAAIIVSDRVIEIPATLRGRCAIYRPPALVLGIGCSRGASEQEITELVETTLATHGLSPLAVAAVASLDRKADEPGLRALVQRWRWPLVTFSAAELAAVAGEWSTSEIVRRAVGVGGVAEPAALRGAGVERLLVRKVKTAHVTLAIARCAEPSAN